MFDWYWEKNGFRFGFELYTACLKVRIKEMLLVNVVFSVVW